MKRNLLEKIGVLVVKKDMVKGLKGRVYSGHVSGKKVGVGCRIGWKLQEGKRKRMEKRLGAWISASKPHVSYTL